MSIIIQLVLSFQFSISYGQAVLFSEGFESGEIPLNWSQVFTEGAISWRYEDGGYTYSPSVPNSRRPVSAHSGEYNALFQYQDLNVKATKLITKKIEVLEFAVKPELHFYHAQYTKSGYNDKLKVYYKNGSSSWILLQEYTEATSDWVERIIALPEGDLSANYYLAFEGEISNLGYGTCIDDIQIVETGILQKYLSNITVEKTSEVSVASGTTNNPLLRLKVKVMGNSGSCPLNSLVLNSLNTADSDIETDGVKLFFTQDDAFNIENQIGSGVSFVSGQAAFSDLNYDLPTGYSYIWVTYDVKSTAGHRDTLDAKFVENSININGETFFDEEKSPAGSRIILQSIHADDFESGLNWVLSGEFQYGAPQGFGGSQGNHDPDAAYSGTYVIGTDLTGLGDYPGDYEQNLSEDAYSAISDTFDFTYYNDLSIRYMRWLNIGVNDEAFIDISADGGLTWKEAWSNPGMVLDDSWNLHEVDITDLAARKNNVLIRFSIGTTNDYWQLSGWNIDDFGITGNYVSRDVGISSVVSPKEGCGHTTADSVTVVVKNYGASDSYGIIPLQYSFDGNITVTYDTLYQVIPYSDSVQCTFKKKADLSNAGLYSFVTSASMNDDEDLTNDAIEKDFYIQPTLETDYTETFETNDGLWMARQETGSSWEWGVPGYGVDPPSGTKLWMTRLIAYYPNNDSSFTESVCYRNGDNIRKILRLKYWVNAESDKDGASVQYSTDNGSTWQLLDTLISGWNWYTDTLQALDSKGWSGNSNGWVTARQILPNNITAAPEMKFRLAFASDSDSSNIGFAFDDFSIITAPYDIGILQIDSFADACQYINPDRLTVTIKNYGINKMRQNDTIIAGFDFQQEHMATDTFVLAADLLPGRTIKHTFDTPVDVNTPGNYNITAYTLIEDEPYFYLENNDTLSLDFEVLPNPLTMLFDSIHTRQPDTVTIRPFYHADYDYLWQDNSTGSTYDVNTGGWYFVTVTATRGNGCSSYDSSYVELLFNDVGVDSLIHPVNHCGLGNGEYLAVRIRNYGTDSIPSGYKIAVAYELNGAPPAVDTLLLAKTLLAGHSTVFDFERWPVDLSEKGMYNFKVYADFIGDTIHANDTLVKNIEIYGHPSVSLGPDITVEAISYSLDAGTGFVSYLWDDGSTVQVREITGSGNYWVQVFDENQCDNSDTTYIRLKIRDVRPDGFVSPVSDCRFDPAEPVILKVMNSGTDTVPSGQQITVSYRLNEGSFVQESFDLAAELLPGAYVTHTFAGDISMNTEADYDFTVTTVMTGDMRTYNDTSELVIYRYLGPVVDFGLDEIAYVEDIQVVIEAGYSPHYSYHWQDNSDEHSFTATSSGLYHAVATDMRTACFDRDTVTVFLIYGDVGVTSSSLPASGCTGNFDDVLVRISNLGTSNIGKDVPIYLACDVNGIRVRVDTLVRSGNFVTGTTMDLVLSGPVEINEGGTSLVAFYTVYAGDKKDWNDTLVVQFDALPSPEINFGDVDGLLNVDLPHELNAGAGHKSYLWQDGSQDPTYVVTQKGEYSVTVTGDNDCQASKTVQVNMSTAIEEQVMLNEVVIYPNPSEGLFTLSANIDVPEALTVKIINSQGQTVYAEKYEASELIRETINVQQLSHGIYYLLIYNDVLIWQCKLIIQ